MSFGASAAPLPTDAGPQAPFANASNRSWRMDGAGFAPSAPEHASSLNDRMAELYEVSARSIPPTGRRAPATWPWRVHAIRRGWWTGARGGWGPVSAPKLKAWHLLTKDLTAPRLPPPQARRKSWASLTESLEQLYEMGKAAGPAAGKGACFGRVMARVQERSPTFCPASRTAAPPRVQRRSQKASRRRCSRITPVSRRGAPPKLPNRELTAPPSTHPSRTMAAHAPHRRRPRSTPTLPRSPPQTAPRWALQEAGSLRVLDFGPG